MMSTPQICAALSQIAYMEPESAEKATRRLGMTWFKWYDKQGSQAMLTGDGGVVYFVPRGTEELSDFIDDIHYVKTDFNISLARRRPHQVHVFGCPRVGNKAFVNGPRGRVHAGFLAALNRIWPDVSVDLNKLDPTMRQIYAGHSLGAAMVTLAAGPGFKPYRYENHLDLVTKVPPPTSALQMLHSIRCGRMPTLYRHGGRETHLSTWRHSMVNYRIGLDRLIEKKKMEAPHVHNVA